jgi:AcrR family transcriptional regulator
MTLPLTNEAVDFFRARLTEVATRLYLERGLEGLSLRALAEAAGVSRTTPYNYFANKSEIVDSIRAAGFDQLTARCERELGKAPGPLEKMRALGFAVVGFARAEPDLYRLMFSGPVFTDEVSPIIRDAVTRFRKVSRPPLEEAFKKRLVRGDREALRRVTWAAFHGLIMLHLDGHLASPRQLEKDFELLNEILGHGILTGRKKK